MPPRKTHEQFVSELSKLNPFVLVLGEYIGNHEKILCQRLKNDCGHQWYVTPHNLLQGCGCPKCAGVAKKTHEEFEREVACIHPSIVLLSNYKAARFKVRCRCTIDGYEWDVTPNNLLSGHGCPKCASTQTQNRLLKDDETFRDELSMISPTIMLLGKYTRSDTKVFCRCLVDGNEWYARPGDLLQGKGCPECKKAKLRADRIKPHAQFVDELSTINPSIKVIGNYQGANTKIRCRCLIDEHEWNAYPANLLKGEGCPICSESHGERAISTYLKQNGIAFHPQHRFDDCKNIRTLPFDFYVPAFSLCIEYDGAQHYRPVNFGGCSDQEAQKCFERTQTNDNIKSQYCAANGIALVRIPYWDHENISERLNAVFKKKDCDRVVNST